MNRIHGWLALSGALLAACAPEARPAAHRHVDPPAATPGAIPDAPVSGTIRGARFVLRDARYVVDRRAGHEHTDIALSSGSAESSCGLIKPPGSTSVWLRLEKPGSVETQDLRLEPGKPGPWTVHYQVREGELWAGSAEAAAVIALHAPGPDGKLSGGLAVCFADEPKSCVSGSFDAEPCPPTIDAPVRGALRAEAIPEKYAHKLRDAGAAP
jgi:hypothetical protein